MEENEKNDRTPVSTNQDGVQNKRRRGRPQVQKTIQETTLCQGLTPRQYYLQTGIKSFKMNKEMMMFGYVKTAKNHSLTQMLRC